MWVSLVAQMVKYLPAMWVTQVRSLGQDDPLEKEMATGRLQSLLSESDTTEQLYFLCTRHSVRAGGTVVAKSRPEPSPHWVVKRWVWIM